MFVYYEIAVAGMTLFLLYLIINVALDFWVAVAEKNNLTGIDMHKKGKKKVAESGGVVVSVSIMIALLALIFIKVFVFDSPTHVIETLAITTTVSIAAIIGFTDDVMGWKKGLKNWQKVVLTLPIAVPLAVLNAGHSTMVLPFIGAIDFGILFALVVVPIGIVGASNGFNLIAGLNGLEAGMGMFILLGLGVVSYFNSTWWITYICAASLVSLAAFYMFNANPAVLFPGNSFTYSIGALIACIAVLGNMEKFAVILFIPYFIELILKARGKFKKESFGVLKDGKIHRKYDKIYSINHIFMPRTEQEITNYIFTTELICLLLCVVIM